MDKLVYRVEKADSSQGPYSYNEHLTEMHEAHDRNNPNTPPPRMDRIAVVRDRHQFGFDSMTALRAWFGGYEAHLHTAGYLVKVFKVDEKEIDYGNKQLTFRRGEAVEVDRFALVEGPVMEPSMKYALWKKKQAENKQAWLQSEARLEKINRQASLYTDQSGLYAKGGWPVVLETNTPVPVDKLRWAIDEDMAVRLREKGFKMREIAKEAPVIKGSIGSDVWTNWMTLDKNFEMEL